MKVLEVTVENAGNRPIQDDLQSGTPITDKLRKKVGKKAIKADPTLEGLLEELGRLEVIRGQLYTVFSDSKKVLDHYTNKAGAENIVVSAVVKEYKAYTNQFVSVTRAINELIGKTPPPPRKEPPDPVQLIRNRGKK